MDVSVPTFLGLAIPDRIRFCDFLQLSKFSFALVESNSSCVLRADRFALGELEAREGKALSSDISVPLPFAEEPLLQVVHAGADLKVSDGDAPMPLYAALLIPPLRRLLSLVTSADAPRIRSHPPEFVDALLEAALFFTTLEEGISAYEESLVFWEKADHEAIVLSVRRVGPKRYKLALLAESTFGEIAESLRMNALPEDLRVSIPRIRLNLPDCSAERVGAWAAFAGLAPQVVNARSVCYPTEVLGDLV